MYLREGCVMTVISYSKSFSALLLVNSLKTEMHRFNLCNFADYWTILLLHITGIIAIDSEQI